MGDTELTDRAQDAPSDEPLAPGTHHYHQGILPLGCLTDELTYVLVEVGYEDETAVQLKRRIVVLV